MKYLWIIFVSSFLFSACNDGDLITKTFNFEGVSVQKCAASNILYKINYQEALILNTPETNFPNTEGTSTINIGGTTSLTYKKYSETASTSEVCTIPTLPVLEQWNVVGGTIEITRNKIFDTDGITVLAYNHNIVFKNVTFVANGEQIVYDTYTFGNYRTNIVNLDFDFTLATTQKCSTNNLIFKFKDNKALLLDVSSSLFLNAATTTPRTAIIDGINNKVVYRIFSGSLNTNYFCASITPSAPILTEEWIAKNGVADVSGIITVETIAIDATHFKHTITLYKTTFENGVQSYIYPLSDNYIFGEYITTL